MLSDLREFFLLSALESQILDDSSAGSDAPVLTWCEVSLQLPLFSLSPVIFDQSRLDLPARQHVVQLSELRDGSLDNFPDDWAGHMLTEIS